MTPAAQIQAAIDVIETWTASVDGLDRVLAAWARAHRFAGSKDRAAIADHAYGAVRRLRSAGWVAGSDDPSARDILRGTLILDGQDPVKTFTGEGYAPARLGPTEQDRRALATAPRPVRLDYPDWMDPIMVDLSDGILEALRHRANVDIRVNTLKIDVMAATSELAKEGILTTPHPLSDTALRITEGPRKLTNSEAYRRGLVEVQDAASQAVANLAAAQPGETVLDLCAGGGGKTLAMAATMENQGRLMAFDVSDQRLAQLPDRAKRAGAKVQTLRPSDLEQQHGKCDLVLVDAPCSGSGAWRRNPDAKWRLSPERLQQLTATQASLIEQAATLTAQNGRIAFVTCSLFKQENKDVVSAFLKHDQNFILFEERQFTPLDGADGFYAAVLHQQ